MEALVVLFLFLLVVGLYLLPTIVGASRGVRNLGSLVVINVLLGWTFIGWVVAMAMAARSVPPSGMEVGLQPPAGSGGPPPADPGGP
jgi:hypothetical protein